jgi:hypothetical protein
MNFKPHVQKSLIMNSLRNVDDIKFEIKQYLNKIEDLSNFCKLNKDNYLFWKRLSTVTSFLPKLYFLIKK